MKKELFEILNKAKKPLSFENIKEKLNIETDEQSRKLKDLLNEEIGNYSIIKTKKENYVLMSKTSFRKGKFLTRRKGNSIVIVNNKYEKDGVEYTKSITYDVLDNNTGNAIDGDIVLVDLNSFHKNGELYADVKKVISRKIDSIVGEVYKSGDEYYVRPIDKKKRNLIIKLNDYEVEGTIVCVNLFDSPDNNNYSGIVTRIFNHKYDPKEDLLLEAFKCGVDDTFSLESLDEIKMLPNIVTEIDKIGREDLTKETVFTIDCSDTKDIDDALSCKVLSNGNYLVGIHIADVSHYVKMNSSLDLDAYRKGTSVYLPGCVIPMLPRELSNGICSLNPGVDRLTISCFIELDKRGNIVNYRICNSVINSNIKMTYDEVNNVLSGRPFDPAYKNYVDILSNLNKFALLLRKKRVERGALSFDRSELNVECDDFGNAISVSTKSSDVGEKLIEEFMVLANEMVDKHLINRGYRVLHRVHGEPIADKMEKYFDLLNALGYAYNEHSYMDCCVNPHYLQELERKVSEIGRLKNLLSYNLIRTMSKAQYSPNNIGHFGLASPNYCHFTSPIRRYPDLVIHRLLKLDMNNQKDKDIASNLDEIGFMTSRMERISQDAEYESTKLKCAEYMEKHIGEEFNGTIMDLDESGLYIELDNLIEGKVNTKDLNGTYVADKDNYLLKSISGDNYYSVGDYLKLKLKSASKQNKSIVFDVIDKISSVDNKKIKIKNKND